MNITQTSGRVNSLFRWRILAKCRVVTASHAAVVIRHATQLINGRAICFPFEWRQILSDIEFIQRKIDAALSFLERDIATLIVGVESAMQWKCH